MNNFHFNLSEKSNFDKVKPIRGGIPVVFRENLLHNIKQ